MRVGGKTLSRIRSTIDSPCSSLENNNPYTFGLAFSSSSNLSVSNCCFFGWVMILSLNCNQILSISIIARVCSRSCGLRRDKVASSGERSFPISSKRSFAWLVSSIFWFISNTPCRATARVRRRCNASPCGLRSLLTFTHSFRGRCF